MRFEVMNDKIRSRSFVVGCARSGTTLLQSFLASHSEIVSFPESHFFANLKPTSTIASILGLPRRKMFSDIDAFRRALVANGFDVGITKVLWPRYRLAHLFVSCLDDLAAQAKCSVWLEKTPRHVFHVALIEKTIPDAKFIHIVRDARDVVSSLHQVTRQAPVAWGARAGRTVQDCVEQWVQSVNETLSYDGFERHHFVYFNDLTGNTRQCLQGICDFLDIEFEDKMMTDRGSQVEKLLTPGEFWKNKVGDAVVHHETRNSKFNEQFKPDEKAYINQATSSTMANMLSTLKVELSNSQPR